MARIILWTLFGLALFCEVATSFVVKAPWKTTATTSATELNMGLYDLLIERGGGDLDHSALVKVIEEGGA